MTEQAPNEKKSYQSLGNVTVDKNLKFKKDTTLNMRISSSLLQEIKTMAATMGYSKYQRWVTDVLEQAVHPPKS